MIKVQYTTDGGEQWWDVGMLRWVKPEEAEDFIRSVRECWAPDGEDLDLRAVPEEDDAK